MRLPKKKRAALHHTLECALAFLSEFDIGGDPTYGHFPGGDMDPREFSPDDECCTPEELEAHKAACAAWDRGERPETERSGRAEHRHFPERTDPETGVVESATEGVALVCGSAYGVGTYHLPLDPEMAGLLAKLKAAIALTRKPGRR